MNWLTLSLVAAGGALGAASRYSLQVWISRLWPVQFPAAILAVNVLGSAVIGALAGALASSRLSLPADARAFLFAGVLGGFTTFSSFSLDTLVLFRSGAVGLALLNVFGHVSAGLLAVYLGYRLAS